LNAPGTSMGVRGREKEEILFDPAPEQEGCPKKKDLDGDASHQGNVRNCSWQKVSNNMVGKTRERKRAFLRKAAEAVKKSKVRRRSLADAAASLQKFGRRKSTEKNTFTERVPSERK